MSTVQRLHRKMLPWLSALVFAANFLCADTVLDLTWPLLGTASQERIHQQPEGTSQEVSKRLTFNLASAQAASTGAKERAQVIDFFKMTMGGIAGLVLFIYGVTRLADSLEELSTDRMRKFLGTATTNRFAGVFTGIVATTLLESSSVTIIMVIAMVSSGVLTFVQSLGVVLGSNIGTAVGAQIISLDIKHYVPALMGLGVLGFLLGRTRTQKNLGLVVLGFGLMFYGLEAIDDAMRPFRTYQPFIDLMQTLGNNPLLGALVGCIFTVIIQSSSATVAIVITLASSGLISLPAGVAIMLGAEVGTCSDTLVATFGRGRQAIRTGVFHLLFNLISAALGIVFAPYLVQLVLAMSPGAGVGRQVANAQILFNLIGVVVVIGFLPAIARGLEWIIPDAPGERQPYREAVQAPRPI
jgi:phosphate:Na+ symporter